MSAEKQAVERMLSTLPFVDNLRHELMELILEYGEAEYTRGFDNAHNAVAWGEF